MFNVRKSGIFTALVFMGTTAPAQSTFSMQQVVDSAVKNSPAINAAQYNELGQKQGTKSAFNLPNPEIVAESPTGEFYTIGVLQSMDFPTVYFKQRQVAKQQYEIAATETQISINDVKYQTGLLYSQLQYQLALAAKLRIQDSLYLLMSESAGRLFDAGQIDFLAKTFADIQYGEVHLKLVSAVADADATRLQLQAITGIRETIIPAPLQKFPEIPGVAFTNDTSVFAANPLVSYYRQQQFLSRKMISLEQHRMLPGIVFGYLNQGPSITPVNLRFRAGITLPLWFWQYTANIKAARFRYMVSVQLYQFNQQRLGIQQAQAQGDYIKYSMSVSYYQETGLQQSETLIKTSERFYASGEEDLVTHLRTLNDAYEVQLNYLEALKNYNQSVIYIHYLNGTL